MKSERINERRERDKPNVNSKRTPADKMPFTFAILFSDRYLAINRVMAEFMPQSLRIAKRFGATTAIASMPMSEGDSSLARNMMPNADMIVELVEFEMNRLKYRVLLNMVWWVYA